MNLHLDVCEARRLLDRSSWIGCPHVREPLGRYEDLLPDSSIPLHSCAHNAKQLDALHYFLPFAAYPVPTASVTSVAVAREKDLQVSTA